jgi:2-methylfumaryl-CoA isomerase
MFPVLEGMRIVEGSAFVAAPMGGMTLAQLGADVIRFDQIGGGLDANRWPLDANGNSLYWASLNKGKRSLAVDLRSPEGRELIAELIARPGDDAGLFLTNLPLRGPLAYEALKARREDVIVLALTGHRDGATALDYTVNCAVGYPLITGSASDEAPVNHVLPAWDVITGLTAATGLLAADRRRRIKGEGQLIGLALSDVAYATVGALGHIAEAQINGQQRGRHGNQLYGAFGGDFGTKDGRRVMVTAITSRQWSSLLEVTGAAGAVKELETRDGLDFSDEGDRFRASDAISAAMRPWFASKTLAQASSALDTAGVCWGPYQSFLQMVAEDPRCSTDNPLFDEVEQPHIGRYLMPASPLNFSELERLPVKPAPQIGEHTDAVLGDVLGLSSGQIAGLHDRGVVAGPA